MIINELEKNNRIEWSNSNIKIEYIYNDMQTFNENEEAKDISDILYYYYDINIYIKVYDYENKPIEKWKLIANRNTYDFPGIISFNQLIKYMLKLDPKENGQKILYNDEIEYCYKANIENWFYDDYYEITKHENLERTPNIWYSLYVGCAIDSQGDRDTTGVSFNLAEETLKEILECINRFIEYSIHQNNKKTRLYNQLHTSNKIIKDNIVWEYKIKNDRVTKNTESFYVIGDKVDINVIENEHVIKYSNTIILNIIQSKIEFLVNKEKKQINLSNIINIFYEPSEKELKYGVEEIAEDLIHIFLKNDAVFNDYKNENTDDLYQKYGNAIINRYWMCRSEHGFGNENTTDPVKRVAPYVKEVIKIIKQVI